MITKSTAAVHNPVRYSFRILLLLTVLIFFVQNNLTAPYYVNQTLTSDSFVEHEKGGFTRQVFYMILGCLGLIGTYYELYKTKSKVIWNKDIIFPMLLLIAWCALSIIWAYTPTIAAKRLLVVCLMFLGSFGLSLSWTKTQIVRFIALSSGIQVAVSILDELAYGTFKPWTSIYRFAGTSTATEEGYLCMVLFISSMCCIAIERAKSYATAVLYRVLAVLGIVFLLLSRSRGALLALAIAILFYFLLVFPPRKKIVALLLTGTTAMALIATGIGAQLLDALNRGGEGSQNLTGRGPLWDELMGYVVERPWTGRGFESFWTPVTADDVFNHQHWPVGSAHSQYIEGLLTIGRIGTGLHTLALLMGIVVGIRLYKATRHVVFFMAASLCCIYLAGGYLEAIMIVKPSPISFYLALLLCVSMFSKVSDEDGSVPARELATALSSHKPLRRAPRWTQVRG